MLGNIGIQSQLSDFIWDSWATSPNGNIKQQVSIISEEREFFRGILLILHILFPFLILI